MVLDYPPFLWPPWNAAENSQRQTRKLSLYLEREHNVQWVKFGVAHATMKMPRRAGLKTGTGSGTSVRLENRCCKCLYAKIKAPILL